LEFYKNNKEWIIPVTILLVGKAIDLVMPWIRSYLENKYLSYKERRISILITRYRKTRQFNRNPVFTNKARMYGDLMFFLIGFILLFLFFPDLLTQHDVIHMPMFVSFYIFVAYLIIVITNDIITLRDFLYFDRYRAGVLRELVKLGGNPEDLDKEETEIQGG